jgi:hypothetical protein
MDAGIQMDESEGQSLNGAPSNRERREPDSNATVARDRQP